MKVFFNFRKLTLGKEDMQEQLLNMEQIVTQSNYHLMEELDDMMTGQFTRKTTTIKAKRLIKRRGFLIIAVSSAATAAVAAIVHLMMHKLLFT